MIYFTKKTALTKSCFFLIKGVILLKRIFYIFFIYTIVFAIVLIFGTMLLVKFISNLSLLTFSLLGLAIGLTLVLSFLLARVVKGPINEFTYVTTRITESLDLSNYASYRSNNELGALSHGMNRMIKGLKRILVDIRDTSELFTHESKKFEKQTSLLADTSAELAKSIESLSNGIINQADRAESSSKTVETMTLVIHEVNESIHRMEDIIKTASERIIYGQNAVNEVNMTIENNVKNTKELERTITSLTEESTQANDIIKLIGDIADQTNLLALNAAIEAARSGEHGHGFSIVADEIRKLAEETAQSVEQVQSMLNNIQEHVIESINHSKDMTQLSKTQEQIATNLDESFYNIASSMKEVTTEMEHLKQSNFKLTTGSEEVLQEIEEITSITQKVASSGEDASARIQEQAATANEIANGNEKITELARLLYDMSDRWEGLDS